ncbi:MAG: LuxR C-terminal-related transcriptional regulator [Burkholderiales bacterium]
MACLLLQRRAPGDAERALALFDEASVEARDLGMHGLEQRLAELRRDAAPRADAGVPVAGLSAREVQVLRLIATGRTNQEIADTLCRSPNTIANHVRNILAKTESANRAEAAAFAVRNGLLPPA